MGKKHSGGIDRRSLLINAMAAGAAATVGMIERSRLYLTLGMLLEGGIPLRDALGL